MNKSKVYFSKYITSENLIEMYKKLNINLEDNVAIKVHSGEAGNQNFLKPLLLKPLVDFLKGIIVECNTAYDGERNSTDKLHIILIYAILFGKYFKLY